MPAENLMTIGDPLRAEYETWLAGFALFGPDHFLRAASDWEPLGQTQADFARSVQEIQAWLDLDSWLTSGFLPVPGVISPPAPASKTSLAERSSGAWPAWPAASPVSPPSFSAEEVSPPGSQPAGPGAASSSGVPKNLIVRPDVETSRQPHSQQSVALLAPIGSLSDLARMVQMTPYNDEAEAPEHPLESQAAPSFTRTMPGAEDAIFGPPGLSPQTRAAPAASSSDLDLAEEWQSASFTDEAPVADDEVGSPSRVVLPGEWPSSPVAPSAEATFLSPAAFSETDFPPASLQPVGRPAVMGSDLDFSDRPGVDWGAPEKSTETRPVDAPSLTPSDASWNRSRSAPEIREGTPENSAEAPFSAGELARLGNELAAGFFSAPAPLTRAGAQPDAPSIGAATDWLTLLAAVTLPGRMPGLSSEKIAGRPVETLSPGPPVPPSKQTQDWNDTPEVVRQIIETDADMAANNSTLSPLDVQDMLNALRQEIWREYRRFYGTVA
ncbi:MAG: hypothetical protein L6R45_16975 [Anaerolineae bacterium]|nr:hypothetical protein [Anaerolineae bacterium]